MPIQNPEVPGLTIVHVAISLAAIVSGFVILFGMIFDRRLDRWNAFFLATTFATSATGFLFPIRGITPGIILGLISLPVLAIIIYARYGGKLRGAWRPVYVIGSAFAFYLNFVVLIVQSFQKIPALQSLSPKQIARPFLAVQVASLIGFIILGTLATKRFRPSLIHPR